ncbi:MAG TPA: uracil-DNA glycosylase [bacterium]|nr:uracil-DNA glycosylase [bacterium]HPG46312.1 uracil-DNA glycosylase [bacterium]HPM98494.1 uracil-DNA glycosylase [bacterium]
MENWAQKVERLLKQQIELYGDEEVLARQSLQELLNSSLKGESSEDWRQSENLFIMNDRISSCLQCPLGYTRKSFVFGNGKGDADILVIGEAPGEEEDRQGFVFVGRAGELLDKILAAINLRRQDIYIANVLKCRPPQNRDPQLTEIAACLPYLHKQIELINPAFILCLGRIAAQTVLQTTTSLEKLRGQAYPFMNASVIVTYHPAALLRFPQYKRATWEDVKLLRKLYDEWLTQKSMNHGR